MRRTLVHTVIMSARIVLAVGLSLTCILLALAVLIGISQGQRDLTEVGSRVLTVGIAALAGALGFEMGHLLAKKTDR